MSVAVVVPVHGNEDTLGPLAAALAVALAGRDWRLRLVVDASPDASGQVAAGLAAADPRIAVTDLAVNVGQHRALARGLADEPAARSWVCMDADLQDPPAAVPLLLDRLAAGDVAAVFAGRRGAYEGRGRLLTGAAHRRALAALTGLPVDAGAFLALDARGREAVLSLGAPSVVAAVGAAGLRVASVPVVRSPRPSGRSSWTAPARARQSAGTLAWTARQRWSRGAVGSVEALLRLLPPVRRSLDQVGAHAAEWQRRADAVLAGPRDGDPLWVVLGDSTAQAVGLADVSDGYVERVRRLLEARDGRGWRVLNLSRSGAVMADVLDVQLPRLADLRAQGWQPALVTCLVGGNDLRRTPLPRLLADLRRLLGAVPDGAVVATLPRGLREPRARTANVLLRQLAAGRGLPVVDLWTATGPPWRGKYADGLHPNAAGVTDWVAALARTLDLPSEQDPPRPRRGLPAPSAARRGRRSGR